MGGSITSLLWAGTICGFPPVFCFVCVHHIYARILSAKFPNLRITHLLKKHTSMFQFCVHSLFLCKYNISFVLYLFTAAQYFSCVLENAVLQSFRRRKLDSERIPHITAIHSRRHPVTAGSVGGPDATTSTIPETYTYLFIKGAARHENRF